MSDLISRADAIEAIESLGWYHQNRNKDMVSGANSRADQPWYKSQDVYDALENLPSVQPRRGKWIDDGTEFGCCCSECGSTLDDYFDGLTEDVRLMKIPDFCLSCGADMRGDNNDT